MKNKTKVLQQHFLKGFDLTSNSFDTIVRRFVEFGVAPSSAELEENCVWQEPLFSEDILISNWKRLLSANMLSSLSSVCQQSIVQSLYFFERQPWNQSSQYLRALVSLNHAFAKVPIMEVGPSLLQSGAALIDLHEYCPWLSLPFTPHHFEFGIYLAALSLMNDKPEWRECVLRIAHWQLNTLDAEGIAFRGLFVRESDASSLNEMSLSYLLFYAASVLSDDDSFEWVSEAAAERLTNYFEHSHEKIDPLWPLFEMWFNQFPTKGRKSKQLSENIYDPSTALVGYRSKNQHVVCTLHGAQTGLGTIRDGDVEIINFGPHYFPLADCRGFGIEGNALSDQGIRRSVIDWRPNAFHLKGCTRMVDQPSELSGGSAQFRGIWIDVSQEYKNFCLNLKTTFLGLDSWSGVGFSFFVKASKCEIGTFKTLLPNTLDNYEAAGCAVVFESAEGKIEICPIGFEGTMQVIPLSGKENFWGADFLVSYHLSEELASYHWSIAQYSSRPIQCLAKTL